MLLVYILALLIVGALIRVYRWRRSMPPGPLPLNPLYGNVGELASGERYEPRYLEWKRKFGPVYTFFVGPSPVVAVTAPQLIVRRRR